MELWHWQLRIRAIFDSKASRQGSALTPDRYSFGHEIISISVQRE